MNWFDIIKFIIQIAPQIFQLIKQAEEVIGAGNGAVKKEIVMAPLVAAGVPAELHAAVGGMIDSMVASRNKVAARPTLNAI